MQLIPLGKVRQGAKSSLILFSALCFSPLLVGQTFSIGGPATAKQKTSPTFTISMSGSSGKNVATIQWTVQLPAGVYLAQSSAACNPSTGICMAGLSNKALTDGTIATVRLTFSKSTSIGKNWISLGNMFAADVNGYDCDVPLTGPGMNVKVSK